MWQRSCVVLLAAAGNVGAVSDVCAESKQQREHGGQQRALADIMPAHLRLFCPVLQTGLYEMKEMVQLTGGQCVQIDSFTNVVFKDSLKRMFAK